MDTSGTSPRAQDVGLLEENLADRYAAVRKRSLELCEPLAIEDYQVQPMDDASPPKWHLAHVTWFFETFLLKAFIPHYKPYNDAFEVLFNSYYHGVGEQFPRPKRGHLSRPTVAEVIAYREFVDEQMQALLNHELNEDARFRVMLGLNHEQQHQELLLTDLKYNLGNNPLYPAYRETKGSARAHEHPLTFSEVSGGVHQIGVDHGPAFAFDNESPRHDVLVRDFEIADRLVTNAEYLAFIEDGGYQRPALWLSDGWSRIKARERGFDAPLYWTHRDGIWSEYTLGGIAPLNPQTPVVHVSGYEADAYARWAECRLPTEPEWEVMASSAASEGNFVESGRFHPSAVEDGSGIMQVFGDVWEWTQSSYSPYPGFAPFAGQLGEYNGKFMANQLVLRGGSCATPESHIRCTYRNFFYPADRWQFSGIRLSRS